MSRAIGCSIHSEEPTGNLQLPCSKSIPGLNRDDPDRTFLWTSVQPAISGRWVGRMQVKPMKNYRNAAHEDPLIAIASGGGDRLPTAQRGALERGKV